jgi:ABC-type transport system involved in multi-copper enzyme maturation permease subunit
MNEDSQFEKGRAGSMWFGGLVYTGVVLAATTLFISFILTAFPENAYFSRFVMIASGVMVGCSMLAFPYALHTWAISGRHRTVTVVLYYAEMGIVALNTIVSFASLLAKYSGYIVPEWIAMYEPFTIVSIVYTLAAWGTVFQLDPTAQAKAKELRSEQLFKQKVADKKLEFLDSIEGEAAILAAANADIQAKYSPRNFNKQPRHFGVAQNDDESPEDDGAGDWGTWLEGWKAARRELDLTKPETVTLHSDMAALPPLSNKGQAQK